MIENKNAMEMFFIIAPCIYLVNIIVAALFVRKYDDSIYKKNLYYWVAYLVFGISQAIVMKTKLNPENSIYIWAFFGFMVFMFKSKVIVDIYDQKNNSKTDMFFFLIGAISTYTFIALKINFNLAIIPLVFFTAWPVLKYVVLLKDFSKQVFTKNGFLICSVGTAIHVLDYAYAANKPELIFPGYLFALVLATGVSAFSFAVLVERALVRIEMKDMLHNTARLSALGGMAGEIAHEINNPLTVVLLNNNQILKKMKDNPELLSEDKKYFINKFETIDKMIHRMSKIVTSLKASYRSAEQDSFSTVSINELLEDAKFLCEIKASKQKIALNILNKDKNNDVKIKCRPVQITQIIQNLILNAIDELEKNSEKWIDVSFAKKDQTIIEIKVVDSGLGITPELHGQIFEALFTTKKDSRGTGLGLSISKRIAEEHGGYLKLDEKSKHTTFIIGLPIGS